MTQEIGRSICAECKYWCPSDETGALGECAKYTDKAIAVYRAMEMKSTIIVMHCITFNSGTCNEFEPGEELKN